MKVAQVLTKEYIFTTEVGGSEYENDFHVEFYPYSPAMKCEGNPVKVVHNFDELIDFLEEMDEND